MIKSLLPRFQAIVVKIAITTDNKLYLAANGHQETFDLKPYNFDINKPVIAGDNHLFDDTVISQIVRFINKKTTKYGLFVPERNIKIAVCNLPNKNSIDHYLDFCELLLSSKIELLRLKTSVDDFFSTEIFDIGVVAIRNINNFSIKTQYLDN